MIVRPGPYICAEWEFGGKTAHYLGPFGGLGEEETDHYLSLGRGGQEMI